MPQPAVVVLGSGTLTIDSTFSIKAISYTDARLESAMHRLVTRIERQKGIEIRGGKTILTVDCGESGPKYATLGEDESYQLDVTPVGARLKSKTVTGALRGMDTFAQLVGSSDAPAIHIEDHPRFLWRGLMLDVSRHWMPVEVVKRNLDAMAAVKLNVFHWHLSDDQGFRIESKKFPKLNERGSDGHFYTQQQVREVIEFANDRGIRVVPEFDMPGHTTSWFVGYSELASAPGPYTIERKWGIFQPTLDPSREETYTFLDGFLGEMSALFPDRFFHMGGDEVDPSQWNSSSSVQAWAKSKGLDTPSEIQAAFNRRVQQILAKYGKTMIGWDEVFDPALPRETVIQSWRGPGALADAARHGYRGILSFGYYLDHLKPASAHYAVDPGGDPHTLGGEACMWSEYVNPETVDSRIWPRTAAIAERLWSPANATDVDSMYARLEAISRLLDATGIHHRDRRMLDRLPGDLTTLVDASEAAGHDIRARAKAYTSLVPLNRLVDALPPESEPIRHMESAIRNGAFDSVHATLVAWSEIKLSGEWEPFAKNLSILGSIGLRALEFLHSGQLASPEWVSQQIATVQEIEKPSSEVILAAARPVRMLVEAAGQKRASVNNK
jgi:hexosaminidase